MAPTAVCSRHHSVDRQLCRWLLPSPDRLSSDELRMTQELIANMLGVRRAAERRPLLDETVRRERAKCATAQRALSRGDRVLGEGNRGWRAT